MQQFCLRLVWWGFSRCFLTTLLLVRLSATRLRVCVTDRFCLIWQHVRATVVLHTFVNLRQWMDCGLLRCWIVVFWVVTRCNLVCGNKTDRGDFPPKRRKLPIQLYGVTMKKTTIQIFEAMWTSNLTYKCETVKWHYDTMASERSNFRTEDTGY